jgi:hypothetical protein
MGYAVASSPNVNGLFLKPDQDGADCLVVGVKDLLPDIVVGQGPKD